MFGKPRPPTSRERAQREYERLCQAPTVAEQMPRFVAPISPHEQMIAARLADTSDAPNLDNVAEATSAQDAISADDASVVDPEETAPAGASVVPQWWHTLNGWRGRWG